MLLAAYEGDAHSAATAEGITAAGGVLIERYPSAVGHLLAVAASRLAGMREVAIVGPDAHHLADAVWSGFHPDLALANRDKSRLTINIQSDGDMLFTPAALWTTVRADGRPEAWDPHKSYGRPAVHLLMSIPTLCGRGRQHKGRGPRWLRKTT